MAESLKKYFEELTTNLLSTLTTPNDYLNKIALTVIIIVVILLLYESIS